MKIKGWGGSGIHCFLCGLRLKEYQRSSQVRRCFSPTRPPYALLRMVDNASQQTVMRRLRHKAVIIGVSLCNEVGSGSLMSSYLYVCQVCTRYFMPYPAIVLTVQSVPLATY